MIELFYKNRVGQWLRNQSNGVQEFTEQCMADLIDRLIRKNTPLIVKKIKLIDGNKKLQGELNKLRRLPHVTEKKHSTFLRVKMAEYIYPVLVAAEFFITYISTIIIFGEVNEDEKFISNMIEGAKVSISAILTLGSAITSDELLQNALPDESMGTQATEAEAIGGKHQLEEKRRKLNAVVSGVFLAFFEVCIIGLAYARANDFENNIEVGKGIVTVGFILAAVAIPIVAGYANWIIGKYKDQYNNTRRMDKIRKVIASNDKKIITIEREIEKNLQLERVKYWKVIRQFNNYKTVYYQKKQQGPEDIAGHYSNSLGAFTDQVIKEYQNQLSKLDARFKSEVDYDLNYSLYE